MDCLMLYPCICSRGPGESELLVSTVAKYLEMFPKRCLNWGREWGPLLLIRWLLD